MRDLLDDDNAIVLRHQKPIDHPSMATEGWTESDVDEIVAALERAYDQRDAMRALGWRARDWLVAHDRTWHAHAAALKDWLARARLSADASGTDRTVPLVLEERMDAVAAHAARVASSPAFVW